MPPATPVAVVTDSTHYLPRELVHRARDPRREPLREPGRAAHEGVGHARLRCVLRRAAHRRRAADDLAAVDRRLHRGLRAARRRRARHRLDPPLRRPFRHGRIGAPGSRRARGPAPHRGGRLAQLRRRPRDGRARRPGRSRRGRGRRAGRRACPSGDGGDGDLVLRRHARVLPARRSHRPRAGVDRERAQRQADPVVLGGHAACRSSASARGAAPSSGCSTTCARVRRTARPNGSSSTSSRPRSRRSSSRAAARSSATSRSSCPRSGRCSGPTPAPGCSASAGFRRACVE